MLPMQPYYYPKATNMPSVVEDSIESLLGRLDVILAQKAPKMATSFQPGLSEEEIFKLEQQYSLELPTELKLLFQWHNGIARTSGIYLTPLEEFYPLNNALEVRAVLTKQLQGAGAEVQQMLGPTLSWVPLFQDVAGDGYYFDPNRTKEDGAIFYNFKETGSYIFFPSIKNVIAGLIECYEVGCYYPDADGQIQGDFERAAKVWEKYGSDSEMTY